LERNVISSKANQVTHQAEKLFFDNQMLAYRLEKKDMEVASLRMREVEVDVRPLEVTIQSLQQEIVKNKKEKDHMNAEWLKLQLANTILKQEVKGLNDQIEKLQVRWHRSLEFPVSR
jgi:dynactin complex subunit